jgi:hypothetical protein
MIYEVAQFRRKTDEEMNLLLDEYMNYLAMEKGVSLNTWKHTAATSDGFSLS